MFTGIVSAVGTITAGKADGAHWISSPYEPDGIAIGASIACAGVCLTVTECENDGGGARFAVDVSPETRKRTAADMWREGARLNLERALKMGDELGGHIVTGHIDAVGRVAALERDENALRLSIAAPVAIAPYLASKGSVTVDGVSLTVNEVSDGAKETVFTLAIIPHTAEVTTLGTLAMDDEVNLEIDILARYLQRMQAFGGATAA